MRCSSVWIGEAAQGLSSCCGVQVSASMPAYLEPRTALRLQVNNKCRCCCLQYIHRTYFWGYLEPLDLHAFGGPRPVGMETSSVSRGVRTKMLHVPCTYMGLERFAI